MQVSKLLANDEQMFCTIVAKIVNFAYIPSDKNYADILTKPLSFHKFLPLVKKLLFCFLNRIKLFIVRL